MMASKNKVGIFGAGGYVARELIHLLLDHPNFIIHRIVSESNVKNKEISSIFPELRKVFDKQIETHKEALYDCDVILTSKPDDDSLLNVPVFREKGIRVIDLSAAYRFKDPLVYEKWYGRKHTSPHLLKEAVCGLSELHRDEVRNANLIAHPGCYPVSVVLGCAPLMQHHLVDTRDIIVDAYSGVSGAGANPSPLSKYMFCEMNENMVPYKIGEHRHTPEMEIELGRLSESQSLVIFVPHLAPIKRGILSSIYLSLKKPYPSLPDLRKLYSDFYVDDFFVRLMDEGEIPSIQNVVGTNFCDVGVFYNEKSSRVVVISAIDNLVKGAAGQAIQNLNTMFNLDETTGLKGVNAEAREEMPDFPVVEKFMRLPVDSMR